MTAPGPDSSPDETVQALRTRALQLNVFADLVHDSDKGSAAVAREEAVQLRCRAAVIEAMAEFHAELGTTVQQWGDLATRLRDLMTQTTSNEHGKELTTQLRMLRERAGLSQEAAGQALDGSRYQLSRIENGRVPGHDELLAMLDLYEVTDEERAAYLAMWELAWQQDGRRVRRERLRGHVDL